MQKNYEQLKEKLNTLYILAKNYGRNKVPYQIVLKEMENLLIHPSEVEEENPFSMQLNAQMEELKEKIKNIKDNPTSKMEFWLNYMYWSAWRQFRKDGIGHLCEFCLEYSYIKCKVNINMSLSKEHNESKEEFIKRRKEYENFIKENNLDLIDISNHQYLKDVDINKKFLNDYLLKFCTPFRMEYSIKDNHIKSFTFYIKKDGTFSFYSPNKKEKEKNDLFLEDAEIERIVKEIETWYQSITFVEDCTKNNSSHIDDYKDTSNRLGLSIYHGMCLLCDVENDITKEYEENVLGDLHSNKVAREKEDEIGSTYDLGIIIDTFKIIRENLEKFLRINYGLSIETFKLGEKQKLTLNWSSYFYNVSKEYFTETDRDNMEYVDVKNINKIFDILEDESSGDSRLMFNDKNIKYFEEEFCKDLYLEIYDIDISYYYGKKYISSITFNIKKLKEFLEKFIKE